MDVNVSCTVIYIINCTEMETLDSNITDAMAQKLYRFHVGLALAGIVTAIICSLTLLYDSFNADRGIGKIPDQMEVLRSVPTDLSTDLRQITTVLHAAILK
jgi:hypothetical protein